MIGRIGRKYIWVAGLAIATLGIAAGCHRNVSASEAQNQAQNQGDPADANMAPVDGSVAQQPQGTVNESQTQADQYGQYGQAGQAAPIERRDPSAGVYPQTDTGGAQPPYDPNMGQDASQPVLEADQPPPPLPSYDQPPAPEPDYIWTPGYWSWTPAGYYWVPGVWCAAPYQGALWTPGYWGFYGGRYRFYGGSWGLYIGFYGGVNYGYGYFGEGYRGGYWNGSHFYYNTAVTRVNTVRITNVYSRTVVVNNGANRVSYNGGSGGLQVRPRPAEIAAMRAPRTPAMTAQVQVRTQAAQNRQQFYNQNKGRPAVAAAPQPIAADRGIQRPAPIRPAATAQPYHPAAQPQQGYRPAQGAPAVQPGVRPAQNNPEVRPQPQPEARPAPQPEARPQAQPQYRPQPEARPVPQPEARPAPQPEARPQQQPRPQPEARPQQEPRPQAEARPAPQQQARPQPQARSAPPPKPAARPAPKEEEKPR